MTNVCLEKRVSVGSKKYGNAVCKVIDWIKTGWKHTSREKKILAKFLEMILTHSYSLCTVQDVPTQHTLCLVYSII